MFEQVPATTGDFLMRSVSICTTREVLAQFIHTIRFSRMRRERYLVQTIAVTLLFVRGATLFCSGQPLTFTQHRQGGIDTFHANTIQLKPVAMQAAADQPSPRTDQNSMTAHAQLLEKARKGRIDVYFEGDSITRRWGTSDQQYKDFLVNWRQNFFGWNAANFGWGGDTTQNILWRLNNGELDNVNPKIIILLAGTNNVGNKSPQGNEDSRLDETIGGIKAILDTCRRKAPEARIVLMGITPRNDNMAVMPIINKINARIAKFADAKKIRYLNINDRLADKDGRLLEGMANKDGLHLDVKGYQVWADALKPIFIGLLGPRAREDHAPPPTGDPSVANRPTF